MESKKQLHDYYVNYTLKGKRKLEEKNKELENIDKKIKKQHLEVFFSTDNQSEEEYV